MLDRDLINVFVIYEPIVFDAHDLIFELINDPCLDGKCRVYTVPDDLDDVESAIEKSDEVWLFGYCEELKEYKIALEKECDIWQMG